MRQADLERIRPTYVVDVLDALGSCIALLQPLDPQDDECADDEGGRDRYRREQVRFDRRPQGKTQYRRWKKGDEEIQHKALRRSVCKQASSDRQELYPILPADGEDGTRLDDDLEEFCAFARVAEKGSGDDQMSGAGYGKEFGQTLDDAKNRRAEKVRFDRRLPEATKKAGRLAPPGRVILPRALRRALADRRQRLREHFVRKL